MIKNNKGVTLITVMISIIIMMIIASTLVYNANTWSKTQALNDMYNDITILRDKVSLYYSSYGKLPILAEYSGVQNISNINQNDNNKYYVIDLDAIENITLKYGKEYKNLKNNAEDDVYVINELSHNIYYIKGIKVEGKAYYTIPGEYTKVEVPIISNIALEKMDGNIAKLSIKGINRSNGVSAIKVYVSGNEYQTYTYTTDTRKIKQEKIELKELVFGEELECYIEVMDEIGQATKSNVITIKNEDTIATATDLKKFATIANSGNTFEGKTVNLINDIDLEGNETNQWTPIGNSTYEFEGIFDGEEHTISNMYINSSNDEQGLFGVSHGTIKNVNIENSTIIGNAFVGGIVARFSGLIENCHIKNNVEIKGSGRNKYGTYVGGIVGNTDTNTGRNNIIKNCSNAATISGEWLYVGGISGVMSGDIVGCYNKGKITNNRYTGGIIGINVGQSNISDCYNIGDINGTDYIGGIAGESHPSSGTLNINNTYSIGTIIGSEKTGDIIGYWAKEGTSSNCYTVEDEITAEKLGSAFKQDTNNINKGYPILNWQL